MFDQRMGDLLHSWDKVLVFYRHGLMFAFNFHPDWSQTSVRVPVPHNADYTVALSTDDGKYGGWDQVQHITYPAKEIDGKYYVDLYLPARTAVVLKEGEIKEAPEKTEKAAETEE